MNTAFAIKIENLSKLFKSQDRLAKAEPVYAVRNINMKVERGQIFGLLGPNGAGKTTTMQMLTTLLKPTSGKVSIAGYDLLKEPDKVRESIGYISQIGGLENEATAIENLVLQARLYGMSKEQALARTHDLVKHLQLEAFANRLVKTYSGGQRRLVDLALGIIHKPAVLFLDEPTLGLDPQNRAHLWQQVKVLRDNGTTILITTHYLDEADALCDRLAIVDHGTLIVEGTPEELKKNVAGDSVTIELSPEEQTAGFKILKDLPFVKDISIIKDKIRVYVECGEESLPLILRTLDGSTITIKTVSLAHPTLDDVFLNFTGRSLREN